MIQDKIFFDEKDPTGVSYNTPFTVYGSYEGRLWSKTPSGEIKYYTQNSDLSVYATTGSNQFNGNQTVTGSLTVTGGITGSVTTASYVEYTGVANKPTLVSGSAQVTYSGLTGVPAGIVSSSAQVGGYNVFATTGSNQFNGSQAVTGSLTVTGQVVAQTLNVQQVTSSIVYSSGSNIFGNSLGNTQQFTGSVSVTGSLTVNGVNYLPLTGGTLTGALIVENNAITQDGTRPIITLQQSGTTKVFLGISSGTSDLVTGDSSGDAVFRKPASSGAFRFSVDGGSTSALTLASTGAATFASTVTAKVNNISADGAGVVLQGYVDNSLRIAVRGSGYNDGARGGLLASTGDFSSTMTAVSTIVQGAGEEGSAGPVMRLTSTNPNANSRNWAIINTWDNYGDLTFRVSNAKDGNALTAGSSKVVILSSGNVGIGTTSPSGILHLKGASGLTNFGTQVLQVESSTDNFSGIVFSGTNGSNAAIRSEGASTMTFWTATGTSYTERMRITSGGYLKASSNGVYNDATGIYHEIKQTGTSQNIIVFRNQGVDPYGIDVGYPSSSPNNTANYFFYGFDSTAQRFSVRSNGGISNYQANDVNLSDERTKKDIEPLESYWDKFKAIQIVKFKYIDQTHDDYNIGVIAQQVEAVAPEFVDVDGWGETINEEEPLKSIYTADLHHATIKVLQEAMAKIESLEAILQRNNIS
jgi:hypothetical protein